MSEDPDDGFELDMNDELPNLLGAEQTPMLVLITISATIVSMFKYAPDSRWCFFGGPALFGIGLITLQYAYHLDPQMMQSLFRFLTYPKFIPSEDGLGASEIDCLKPAKERRKDRFSR